MAYNPNARQFVSDLDPYFGGATGPGWQTMGTDAGQPVLPSTQVGQGYMASPSLPAQSGGYGSAAASGAAAGAWGGPVGMGVGAGVSVLGQYLSNRGQGQNNERDRQQRMAEFYAAMLADEEQSGTARAQMSLNSTQMNPVAQPNHMFQTAARGALAARGPSRVGPGFQSDLSFAPQASQYLNDTALSEAAARFYANVAQINPEIQGANLPATGLGMPGQAYQGYIDDARASSMDALNRRSQQRRQALLAGLSPASRHGFLSGMGGDYFARY